MAGPAAALIPVTEEVRAATQALTADLVVFRAQVFRKVSYKVGDEEREFLTPIDVETHVNALGLGILGTVLVAGGIAAWLLWDGLAAPTPLGPVQIFRGMKESPFWKTEASRARARLTIRRLRKGASSGEGTIPDPGLFDKDPCVVSKAVFDAETNATFQAAMKAKAKKAGCAWAQ